MENKNSNNSNKIAIHWEGGLGDCLLAHRLTPAVREKHGADAIIDIFINTDGNPYHESVFKELFGNEYNSITTLPKRLNKDFEITTILGKENYPAHLDNLPKESLDLFKTYKAFYNFHIDGLEWTRYDLNWQKYFRNFERPTNSYPVPANLPEGDFIMAHLFARPNSDRKLEDWYIKSLIQKIAKKYKLVLIIEEKFKDYYSDKIPKDYADNVTVLVTDFKETMAVAEKCKLFIGMDSSIRYMPMFYNKPSFVFNKYCQSHGNVPIHQLIRWGLDENFILPMHHDSSKVVKIIDNTLQYSYGYLFPKAVNTSTSQYAGYNFPAEQTLAQLAVDRFYKSL